MRVSQPSSHDLLDAAADEARPLADRLANWHSLVGRRVAQDPRPHELTSAQRDRRDEVGRRLAALLAAEPNGAVVAYRLRFEAKPGGGIKVSLPW